MIRKQNSYLIYDPKNDNKGQSYIEYVAYAHNESEVRLMAGEQGIDLSGFVIELDRTNVVDQLGHPVKSKIMDATVS